MTNPATKRTRGSCRSATCRPSRSRKPWAILQRFPESQDNQRRRKMGEQPTESRASKAGELPRKANQFDLPPLPPIPERLPLGPETERAWMDCFKQINAAIARISMQHQRNDLKPVSAEDVRKGFATLQGGGETKTVFLGLAYFGMDKEYQQSLSAFWQRPELHPAHLIRFLVAVGSLRRGDQQNHRVLSYGYWMESLVPVFRRAHPEV